MPDSAPADVRARAEARLQLGVHHAAQGEPDVAIRQFTRVDPCENREAAARAFLRLHRLLISAGEADEAWDALARAGELSDPHRSPDVELELAARAGALGQNAEAEQRYRSVFAALTDAHRLGALAAFRLGDLRCEQGFAHEALWLWRSALRGCDEDLRPHVLSRLADALCDGPGDSEAAHLYRCVLETDHPHLAPRAALALACLLERHEQTAAALEMYALAGSADDPEISEVADLRRRVLLRRGLRAAVRRLRVTATDRPKTLEGEPIARTELLASSCPDRRYRSPPAHRVAPCPSGLSAGGKRPGIASLRLLVSVRTLSEHNAHALGLMTIKFGDISRAERNSGDWLLFLAAPPFFRKDSIVWPCTVDRHGCRSALAPPQSSRAFLLFVCPCPRDVIVQPRRYAQDGATGESPGPGTRGMPVLGAASARLEHRCARAGTWFIDRFARGLLPPA